MAMERQVKPKMRRKVVSQFRKVLRLCDQAIDAAHGRHGDRRTDVELEDVRFFTSARQHAVGALAQCGELPRRAS